MVFAGGGIAPANPSLTLRKLLNKMKITKMLLSAGLSAFLGHSAFADCTCNPLAFAVTQNGHGSYHWMFYQTNPGQTDTSVALDTANGGPVNSDIYARTGILPDEGQTKFVIGTNQHANATAAYVPVSSNFGQARQ